MAIAEFPLLSILKHDVNSKRDEATIIFKRVLKFSCITTILVSVLGKVVPLWIHNPATSSYPQLINIWLLSLLESQIEKISKA